MGSAGSSVGFFRPAVTKACFSDAGSLPLWKDALHKAARIGANCVADCLTSQVGITWRRKGEGKERGGEGRGRREGRIGEREGEGSVPAGKNFQLHP